MRANIQKQSVRLTLCRVWEQRRRSAYVYSEFVRVWVRLILEVQFYGSLIALALTLFSRSSFRPASMAFFYLGTVAYLVVIIPVRYKVKRFYRATLTPVTDPKRITPLSAEDDRIVRPCIVSLAAKLNVSSQQICLYDDNDDWGIAPRMIESNQQIHIILPLGFIPLLNEQSAKAEAMLAHELGHAAQRDTASWVYATAFAEYIFRWLVPLLCVELLLTFLWGAVSPEIRTLKYETDQHIEIQTTYTPDPKYGFPTANYEPKKEVTYQTVKLKIPGPVDYAREPIILLLMVGSFFLIRRGRRLSEEMADLAALIAATPEGLRDALKAATPSTDKEPKANSNKLEFHFHAPTIGANIHPPITSRLQQIEYYRAIFKSQ